MANIESEIIPMKKVAVILFAVIIAVVILVGGGLFWAFSGGFTMGSESGAGDGEMLNGIWEIDGLGNNDEFVRLTFDNESFVMITETFVANADVSETQARSGEIEEHYRRLNGGISEVIETDEGGIMIRVTVSGTFTLSANELRLHSGDITTLLPFAWEGNTITVNDDIFTRPS